MQEHLNELTKAHNKLRKDVDKNVNLMMSMLQELSEKIDKLQPTKEETKEEVKEETKEFFLSDEAREKLHKKEYKYRILDANNKVKYTGTQEGSWFTLERAKELAKEHDRIFEYDKDGNKLWEVL